MNDLTRYHPPKTATVQTDTFLSPEELHDLTGYRNAHKQCEQLKAQRIPFVTNARGYPRVHRHAIDPKAIKPKKPTQTWQPQVKAA